MKMKQEIYSYKKIKYEKEIQKLSNSTISNTNKKLIKEFLTYLSSVGSGKERVYKLSFQLRKITAVLNNDLNTLNKQDIVNYLAHLNMLDHYSDATKCDYRRALKQFFKWFKDEDIRLDDDNKEVRKETQKFYNFLEKEVSITYKHKQIDPTSILTEEDIEKVVSKGANKIKEKALIKFLHETGIRTGELLNLKRKDIVIKKQFGEAYVNGKTGRRVVQFTNSKSYLVQWLEVHPFKNDNEYIWISESSNRYHKPLKYIGASKLIKRCFEKAEVKKKCNLHWFRHSRASLLAPHLPEALLCKYMGWVLGSRQVKTYLHLCPQQLEDAFLKMKGLAKEEKKEQKPQICGCGETNDFFSRYCYKCGTALNVETAVQDQEMVKTETDKAVKEMLEMFQNPTMLKSFMEFKQKQQN